MADFLFDAGALFPGRNRSAGERVELPPVEEPETPGLLRVAASAKDVESVVDLEWMTNPVNPPMVGRDDASNNVPYLIKFREFNDGVMDEKRAEAEREEAEFWDTHQRVVGKLEDLLDQARDDHDAGARVTGVIKQASERFPALADSPVIQMLSRQVGVAGKLYVFAARTERAARAHAQKMRTSTQRQRPAFVVLKTGSQIDARTAQRIYRLPVREKLAVRKEDLNGVVAALCAAGEDGMELAASVLRTARTASEAWADLNRARKYVAFKGTGSQPAREGKVVAPDRTKQPIEHFEGYEALGELHEDEFDTAAREPEGEVRDKLPWDAVNNAIFATIARRDFKQLRKFSRPGARVAGQTLSPRSVRQRVLAVMASPQVKGLRLYVEDFPRRTLTASGTPTARAVAQTLGLSQQEMRGLTAALQNVTWVSERQVRLASVEESEQVRGARQYSSEVLAAGTPKEKRRAQQLMDEVRQQMQAAYDLYDRTDPYKVDPKTKAALAKARKKAAQAVDALRKLHQTVMSREVMGGKKKRGWFGAERMACGGVPDCGCGCDGAGGSGSGSDEFNRVVVVNPFLPSDSLA